MAAVALAVVLASCSQPTAADRGRVEDELARLDGVSDARINLSVPGFTELMEPKHHLTVRLDVEASSPDETVDAAVLDAARVVWRSTDEWLDIDRLEVRASLDIDGASSLGTDAEAVVGLREAIGRSAVPRAASTRGRDLSACEAWATFGDRTAEPYRSTTQWAVSGCDDEVTVVLPDGVEDHPDAPFTVHLRNVAAPLSAVALVLAFPVSLVVWSGRARRRRRSEVPPPPTGARHPSTPIGRHRWTSPGSTPPRIPPPPPPPPRPPEG